MYHYMQSGVPCILVFHTLPPLKQTHSCIQMDLLMSNVLTVNNKTLSLMVMIRTLAQYQSHLRENMHVQNTFLILIL